MWRGKGEETTVWLISWDRPERKENGRLDGSRRRNHYAAHFMNKPESNVEGCRRGYAAHFMERPESSGEGCRRRNHCAAHFMEKIREKGEWMGAGVETTMRLISWKRPERRESSNCSNHFMEKVREKGEWRRESANCSNHFMERPEKWENGWEQA